jgi:hypothetical protein
VTTRKAATTRVARDDACLVTSCRTCGTALRQVDRFDRAIALGTLFQDHPPWPAAIHRPAVPAGGDAGAGSRSR